MLERTLQGFMKDARQAIDRWRTASDPEGLHDFRVAVRHLRSAARAWAVELGDAVTERDRGLLASLQEITNVPRDAEIAIALLGALRAEVKSKHHAALGRLAAEEQRALDAFRASLEAEIVPVFEQLERELGARLEESAGKTLDAPAAIAAALAPKIAEHGEEASRRARRVRGRGDRKRLHAARIAVKRLRYLLEPAASWVPSAATAAEIARKIQNRLGAINDAFALAARLEDRPAPEAIRRAARRYRHRHFRRLGARALARGLPDLARAAVAAAAQLEMLAPAVERERKFLLRRTPVLHGTHDVQEIDQGYLPGERVQERLRRVRDARGVRYLRTVKLGAGLSRIEVEEEISPELFERLWPLTETRRVRKERHRVADDGHVWEIDVFRDRPLILAEVELSPGEPPPAPPPWLAPTIDREVTGDSAYLNRTLAR